MTYIPSIPKTFAQSENAYYAITPVELAQQAADREARRQVVKRQQSTHRVDFYV